MMNDDLGMLIEDKTQEQAPAEEPTPYPSLKGRGEEAPAGPVGVRVAIQGRQVVVLVGETGISLFPAQALGLAGMIRNYANQVLHAEHESLARERRAAREKGRKHSAISFQRSAKGKK